MYLPGKTLWGVYLSQSKDIREKNKARFKLRFVNRSCSFFLWRRCELVRFQKENGVRCTEWAEGGLLYLPGPDLMASKQVYICLSKSIPLRTDEENCFVLFFVFSHKAVELPGLLVIITYWIAAYYKCAISNYYTLFLSAEKVLNLWVNNMFSEIQLLKYMMTQFAGVFVWIVKSPTVVVSYYFKINVHLPWY